MTRRLRASPQACKNLPRGLLSLRYSTTRQRRLLSPILRPKEGGEHQPVTTSVGTHTCFLLRLAKHRLSSSLFPSPGAAKVAA